MQISVRDRFNRSAIACVHVILEKICILPTEVRHQCDAHKLQRQIYEAFFRMNFWCASVYLRMVLLYGEGLWDLVTDASVPSVFPSPGVFAVRNYLAWCFRVPLQEVVPNIVGLRRQSWLLLNCIHLVSSWFPRPMLAQHICVPKRRLL